MPFSCIVPISGRFLARPAYSSWNYPTTKHYGYFFCESWVAKGKIPIAGLADLVNNARLQLMTEGFSLGGLPFGTGPSEIKIPGIDFKKKQLMRQQKDS